MITRFYSIVSSVKKNYLQKKLVNFTLSPLLTKLKYNFKSQIQ